jgi:serine/threonine protein kinase
VGPSADIWSLGMVLLECLTGRRVYEGTSSEIIGRRLAGPVPLPGDIPVPWKLLLSGMLDHRPDQRLNGEQVASLLSSEAFTRPWSPSVAADTERVPATVPLDLTALAPGDHTAAMLLPQGTRTGTSPPTHAPPDRHRAWWIALAVLVVAALGGGLAYGLNGSAPTVNHPATHATSQTRPTTTTTASTTTTTTAPPLTAPTALAALVRDVATGVDGGTLTSGVGQAISSQSQQAVNDEAAGRPGQATNDLQQVAATIETGEQDGTIQPSEGSLLQGDLASLASTLGLSAASNPPPTSTTTPTPAPPSGGPTILGPGVGQGQGDHGKHG